jgi:hypothetical protein
VIGPTGAVRVMMATKPVDFRKGAEGLAALVREEMQADPFSGAVYVFRAKRADRVKLIFWDGTGRRLIRDCGATIRLPSRLSRYTCSSRTTNYLVQRRSLSAERNGDGVLSYRTVRERGCSP